MTYLCMDQDDEEDEMKTGHQGREGWVDHAVDHASG